MSNVKKNQTRRLWKSFQWWIQDFPEGCTNPKGEGPTYYLTKFFQKLHENEEILAERGACIPGTPLRSATGFTYIHTIYVSHLVVDVFSEFSEYVVDVFSEFSEYIH